MGWQMASKRMAGRHINWIITSRAVFVLRTQRMIRNERWASQPASIRVFAIVILVIFFSAHSIIRQTYNLEWQNGVAVVRFSAGKSKRKYRKIIEEAFRQSIIWTELNCLVSSSSQSGLFGFGMLPDTGSTIKKICNEVFENETITIIWNILVAHWPMLPNAHRFTHTIIRDLNLQFYLAKNCWFIVM